MCPELLDHKTRRLISEVLASPNYVKFKHWFIHILLWPLSDTNISLKDSQSAELERLMLRGGRWLVSAEGGNIQVWRAD